MKYRLTIQVVPRDGIVQAQGEAHDVLALLILLDEANVERICATVNGSGSSIVWALKQ